MTHVPQLTFVNAAGLIAVLDRTDPAHQVMSSLWRLELDAGSTLVTTDYAVVKASLELQRRHGLAGLPGLLDLVLPALRLEVCARRDLDLAVAALLSSEDATQDLVDHVDGQVKRRLHISADLVARWI